MKIINLVLIIMMIFSTNAFADNAALSGEIIYPQDDKCIIRTDFGIQGEYEFFVIPLRSALEAIGATVTWNSNDRKIGITYKGQNYIVTLDVSDIDGYFEICKSKYEDYKRMDLSLLLSPWGGGGAYEIIDDSTYVDDCAIMRLLYYFEYYIDIDKVNQTFEILPVNEDTDKMYLNLYEDYCSLQPVDNEIECLTLDVWCCNEYSYQYGIFDVISCSSQRLDNDDLVVTFEFTYNDKELEQSLYNKELWEIVNDDNLLDYFNGEKVYKRVRNENVLYDYYVIKCNEYYIGYSVVPSLFLK